MLIDTHCHLASRHFDQTCKPGIIARAAEAGVGSMVTLGTSAEDWQATIDWAREFPGVVRACLGIHPNDAHEAPDGWQDMLARAHAGVPLAAIGETGLDYYHPAPEGFDDGSFRALQRDILAMHFDLAARLGLNIVLHTRDRKGHASFDDTLAIAAAYAGKVRPVFHCFIGTREQAARVFDEVDGLISLTGIATFNNPGHVADVAAWCPQDRFMLETDAPYLSPEPKRGRTNEPAYLAYLAARVAELRGIAVAKLAEFTTATARDFFRLRA